MSTALQQVCMPGPRQIELSVAYANPTVELRNAIRDAIDDLQSATATESLNARFERMLLRFTLAIGPLQGRFEAATAADPRGPLAQALRRLAEAFASAADGDIDATRTALISALGLALRLVKDGEPDAVGIDLPSSRVHL